MDDKLASEILKEKKSDPAFSMLDSTNYDFIPVGARNYIENITEMRIEDGVKNHEEKLVNQARCLIKFIGEEIGLEHIFSNIAIDSLHTQSPYPFVQYMAKDQSFAIGFDSKLFAMIEHLLCACIYIVAVTEGNEEHRQKALMHYREIILACVHCHIYNKHVDNFHELIGELFLMTKKIRNLHELALYLQQAALNFIITHELGHICCGHFKNHLPLHYADMSEGEPLLSTFKHQQEYQADEWSYNTLLSIENDKQLKVYLTKTFQLLFSIITIIERLYSPKTIVGKLIISAHPKASDRLVHIRNFDNSIGEDTNDYGANLLENAILTNLKMAGTIDII